MNRGLLVTLVLVVGASLYVATQSDDNLAAPARGGRERGVQASDSSQAQAQQAGVSPHRGGGTSRPGRDGTTHASAQEAWIGAALIDGVQRWQQRVSVADVSASAASDRQAWVSMQPPPPPPPPAPASVAPPVPVAPPFPHQWVGRLQDVPVGAASGAVAQPVWRAVVTGPVSTWVLKSGDVIEGQWRIDRIQERTMSVTYLPLQQQQTVVMR